MRTDFNAIIDSQCTHTHRDTYRHCHIVWQHDATAVLATPCPQVLRDFSLFLPIGHKRPSSQQSMGNLQHATCNRQAGRRTFNAECRTPKFSHLVTFVLNDFQPSPKIQSRKSKSEIRKLRNNCNCHFRLATCWACRRRRRGRRLATKHFSSCFFF